MNKLLLKWVFAGVLVILVVLLFVHNGNTRLEHYSIVPEAFTGTGQVIKTEDIVQGKFYSKNANCSWVVGDYLSWISKNGDLVKYGVASGVKDIVIRSDQFVGRPWKVRFSGDGANVLVGFEPRRLFRSTILARYAVHSTTTGQLSSQLKVSGSHSPDSFQAALWTTNTTLVGVYKSDLYAIQLLETGGTKVKRITADGSDTVSNGVADWVYEEEVFTQSATTIYPSPSGSAIAWIKFNDSLVEPASYNLYGDYSQQPHYDEYFQYTKYSSVRYPKSGTTNPTVSLHLYHLSNEFCWGQQSIGGACSWDLDLQNLMGKLVGETREQYIVGAVKWVDENNLAVQVLNRVQNSTWMLNCDVHNHECKVIRKWDQDHGWIDISQLVPRGNEILTLMSVSGSDGNEYNHVGAIGADRVRFITRGSWSVDEIVGVFGDNLIIKAPLLTLKGPVVQLNDSTQTHYYGLNLTNPLSTLTCLTCYSTCTYNTAKFSATGNYFVNSCERQKNVLQVHLNEIGGGLKVHQKLKLEENKGLETLLSNYELPQVDYFTYDYKLGQKTYKVNLRVIGAKGWRERHRDVAVIVDVYGGPNSQKVTRRFTANDWSLALTSNLSTPIVYLTIDGIGSGRQSNSLSFEMYRDLGNHEIIDKIKILKRFVEENSAINPKKTMIWGWSYGGYLTAMVMGKDVDQVYKCGVSVAPVVNWNYYDTIYTERYMSTPEDNPVGYNSSNVLQYLDNFRNKKFLLVHGNADDNVHYQQSMVLARGLEQKNILFRMHSYPDENHSLGGVRPHLFSTLDDFVLNQCFKD